MAVFLVPRSWAQRASSFAPGQEREQPFRGRDLPWTGIRLGNAGEAVTSEDKMHVSSCVKCPPEAWKGLEVTGVRNNPTIAYK